VETPVETVELPQVVWEMPEAYLAEEKAVTAELQHTAVEVVVAGQVTQQTEVQEVMEVTVRSLELQEPEERQEEEAEEQDLLQKLTEIRVQLREAEAAEHISRIIPIIPAVQEQQEDALYIILIPGPPQQPLQLIPLPGHLLQRLQIPAPRKLI
jgi:uncharacterized protein YaiE (UPF0345 family)